MRSLTCSSWGCAVIKEVDGVQIHPIGLRANIRGLNGVMYSIQWQGDAIVIFTIDIQTRQRLGRIEYSTRGELEQPELEQAFYKLISMIKRTGTPADAYAFLNQEARRALKEKADRQRLLQAGLAQKAIDSGGGSNGVD